MNQKQWEKIKNKANPSPGVVEVNNERIIFTDGVRKEYDNVKEVYEQYSEILSRIKKIAGLDISKSGSSEFKFYVEKYINFYDDYDYDDDYVIIDPIENRYEMYYHDQFFEVDTFEKALVAFASIIGTEQVKKDFPELKKYESKIEKEFMEVEKELKRIYGDKVSFVKNELYDNKGETEDSIFLNIILYNYLSAKVEIPGIKEDILYVSKELENISKELGVPFFDAETFISWGEFDEERNFQAGKFRTYTEDHELVHLDINDLK